MSFQVFISFFYVGGRFPQGVPNPAPFPALDLCFSWCLLCDLPELIIGYCGQYILRMCCMFREVYSGLPVVTLVVLHVPEA